MCFWRRFLVLVLASMMSPRQGQQLIVSGRVVNAEGSDTNVPGECTTLSALGASLLSSSCVNGISWLGGEPSLLSVEEDTAGVQAILNVLTEEELSHIVHSDTTLPIRFFRGAKVSERKLAIFSFFRNFA